MKNHLNLISFNNLLEYLNQRLDSTWKWLGTLMDSTEAQLRFGCSLSASIADSNVTSYLKSLEDKAINNSTKANDINRRKHTTSTNTQILNNLGLT